MLKSSLRKKKDYRTLSLDQLIQKKMLPPFIGRRCTTNPEKAQFFIFSGRRTALSNNLVKRKS